MKDFEHRSKISQIFLFPPLFLSMSVSLVNEVVPSLLSSWKIIQKSWKVIAVPVVYRVLSRDPKRWRTSCAAGHSWAPQNLTPWAPQNPSHLLDTKEILVFLLFLRTGYLHLFFLGFSQNIGWFPLSKWRGKGNEQLSVWGSQCWVRAGWKPFHLHWEKRI